MQTQTTTIPAAGDPFSSAKISERSEIYDGHDECGLCFRGYLTMSFIDDEEEVFVAVKCRKCSKEQ